MKWLPLVFTFVLLLGAPYRAHAHDLGVDLLTLWPEARQGVLRGQLLFDPRLTRPRGAATDEAARANVLRFLRENLHVEVDGKRQSINFEVRELWTGDGAMQGDSVMLRAPLPPTSRELRILVGSAFPALAVSVEMPDAQGSLVPRSTLALGGQATPAYRLFEADPGAPWLLGGSERLPLGSARHSDDASGAVSAPPSAAGATGFVEESSGRVAFRYLRLGIGHIVPAGWDHVLFVSGLVLGSRRRTRALLVQLAGFTIAHTATLALGTLGLVLLPSRLIEPLIALSIVFIGVENLLLQGAVRHRLAWVIGFGFLHGQGFAGALLATGIPPGSFLLALLSFNVGVELGQLLVVAVLLLLLSRLHDEKDFARYAARPGSLAIALAGLVWAAQRIFWPA